MFGAWEFSHGNQSEDLGNFSQMPDMFVGRDFSLGIVL